LYASETATLPALLIVVPLNSNGRATHGFVPTTVQTLSIEPWREVVHHQCGHTSSTDTLNLQPIWIIILADTAVSRRLRKNIQTLRLSIHLSGLETKHVQIYFITDLRKEFSLYKEGEREYRCSQATA
jgi:hypothetical protein